MRKLICAALCASAVIVAALPARCAEDYIDSLKAEVRGYENMTSGRFAPMYEPLARQMVEDYGLKTGVGIDIGSSCSSFPLDLAKKTEMTVYALDLDPAAMQLLGYMADKAELAGRVIPVIGDAQDMPFKDNFADFLFSRGCIPFVPDQAKMVREAYRVLKPGGVAYIGHGGFGRLLDPKIRDGLVKWRLGWGQEGQKKPGGWKGPKEKMLDMAKAAGIKNCRLVKEPDVGWWLEMRK